MPFVRPLSENTNVEDDTDPTEAQLTASTERSTTKPVALGSCGSLQASEAEASPDCAVTVMTLAGLATALWIADGVPVASVVMVETRTHSALPAGAFAMTARVTAERVSAWATDHVSASTDVSMR